ncbi:hypothetical protein MRB53_022779 [Persea americana]|uniref:Uncharacterized protein n=1 Tax=Persea americana TaxID=3435 RepID=A0ACC2L7G4_PERAE|nr:hypothetical protein MRB53_022779 [Persea americana]
MASSSSAAAQILVLGGASVPSSSRSPGIPSSPARTLFFGHRPGNTGAGSLPWSAFLRASRRIGGRRFAGPVRVVNEKVVGIDLGTTNSAVAAMEGGKPTIVTNAEGQRTTPSVVAYTKNGDRLVGQIAKRQAVVNPENTFFSVKRFIGRKMSEVDEESKQVSYRVVRDENGNVKLECPAIGKQFAAEEISAQVLRKLVDDASKFLNDKFLVAWNVVLEVGDGVFEVLSTSGDTHLGGDDFDKRVVDWLASSFKRDEGIDLLKDKQALQRLTETGEKAKMELSTLSQTNISLPFITATADGPKHIETNITRAKFEELCSDLLDRLKTPVDNALRDAKLSFKDLDEIEVKFDIDANGILSVTAVDKGTGKKQDITITGASTLPNDEVEKMVKEAERFAKEDKEKRDAVDTKNQAESLVYQTEKQLKELGDKVPGPIKEKVESKLRDLKDAISGGSPQGMKDAMNALNQEVMQIGQSLYNQPGAPGAGPGPAPDSEAGPSGKAAPDGGDVIDADFTDSK